MRLLNGNRGASFVIGARHVFFALSILAGVIALLPMHQAQANDEGRYDGWYFTAEEIHAAYSYQESYGERLHLPWR